MTIPQTTIPEWTIEPGQARCPSCHFLWKPTAGESVCPSCRSQNTVTETTPLITCMADRCVALVNSDGWLLPWTTAKDVTRAVKQLNHPKPWRDLVAEGWRVIDVRVVPR